jgi:hypothetical protein
MVQDMIDRNLLIGKSRSEVLEVVGQPDYGPRLTSRPIRQGQMRNVVIHERTALATESLQTLRCSYFWECTMNVNFNKTSYRVDELNVSD